MAATTYIWNTIASTQTDGDSPLDETLMEAIRQNLISLEEWMGDDFAQEKNHDHDGINSALISGTIVRPTFEYLTEKLYTAGNTIVASNSSEVSNSGSTSPVGIKEIVLSTLVKAASTLRIQFSMRKTPTGGAADAYGRIYRNGVAVGALQATNSGTYVSYSQDIAGWAGGDQLQLFIWTGGGNATYARDLQVRVYTDSTLDHNNTLSS